MPVHGMIDRVPAAARVMNAAVAILLFSVFLPHVADSGRASEDRSEILASVNGARMMDTVGELEDFGSRAFHLNTSEAAAVYIHGRFTELGLETSFQNFTFGGHMATNVIAVMPGQGTDPRTIVMGAHYDSENMLATNLSLTRSLSAPGADDDASGVAAVIELATVMAGIDSSDTLKFVAFGAEELGYDETGGLKGSSHFVSQEFAAGAAYECAVIFDMIGYRSTNENRITVVNRNSSDAFAPQATQAVSDYGLDLKIAVKTSQIIDYSDHASFWNVNYEAVLITEELASTVRPYPLNPYYHTSFDTSDKLSESQITEVTRCVAAVVLDLAGAGDVTAEGIGLSAFAALAAVIGVAVAVPTAFRIRRSRWRRRP